MVPLVTVDAVVAVARWLGRRRVRRWRSGAGRRVRVGPVELGDLRGGAPGGVVLAGLGEEVGGRCGRGRGRGGSGPRVRRSRPGARAAGGGRPRAGRCRRPARRRGSRRRPRPARPPAAAPGAPKLAGASTARAASHRVSSSSSASGASAVVSLGGACLVGQGQPAQQPEHRRASRSPDRRPAAAASPPRCAAPGRPHHRRRRRRPRGWHARRTARAGWRRACSAGISSAPGGDLPRAAPRRATDSCRAIRRHARCRSGGRRPAPPAPQRRGRPARAHSPPGPAPSPGRCSRRWPGRPRRSAPPGPAEPLRRRSRSARTSQLVRRSRKRACEVPGS